MEKELTSEELLRRVRVLLGELIMENGKLASSGRSSDKVNKSIDILLNATTRITDIVHNRR